MQRHNASKEEITERIQKLKSSIRYHMNFVEKYKDEAYELTTYLREREIDVVTEYMLKNEIDPDAALLLLKKYVSDRSIPISDRIA
jgi:RNase H-fold protein (predicted Holliday junction resolvase)